MERLKATWLNKLLILVPPWLAAAGLAWAAGVFHHLWGTAPWALAAVAGMGACAATLTLLTWLVCRQRGLLGRLHAAATAALTGGWVCLATLYGVNAFTGYLLVTGGVTLCLSWDIRVVVRQHAWDAENAGQDRISAWFRQIAGEAGLPDAELRVRQATPRKVLGIFQLKPGAKTADDAVKAAGRVESGLRFPPGSVLVAPNLDRADQAHVTITDPRVLRKPVPWPGPSHPGASIADPIHVGLWQDQEVAAWAVPGHHKQVMGMTGAGKSIGACWSYLGEAVTRRDEAVFGADITKGDQTLGPLRPALHKLETSPDGARRLVSALIACVKARTDYLAARGLQRWKKGCGLTHLTFWMEECPDILDALGDKGLENFLSFLKAARSAGIDVVMSLQRSDYSQMPTLARGQLANWCFGVANGNDAAFGLSELQAERDCRPELWANKQPGMAFLDAPSIPDGRCAMPLRTWFWGEDDAKIAKHAAAYPAATRPLDELTAGIFARVYGDPQAAEPAGESEEQEEDVNVAEEYAGPDPDPEQEASIDDEIEVPDGPFGEFEFPEAGHEKATPEAARAAFTQLLEEWRGERREMFATGDLAELLEQTGMSRAWGHKQINAAIDAGLIEAVTDPDRGRFGRYAILP